jgi:hypothetical protein
MSPTFSVFDKRKFIRGETIGFFCGKIKTGVGNSRLSIYARKLNGIAIDPEIGLDDMYTTLVRNPLHGMFLHHISVASSESNSNAMLSD